MNISIRSLLAGVLIILCCVFTDAMPKDKKESGERIKARLVDTMGTIPGKSTATVNIQIDKYSTDDEIKQLLEILVQKGPEELYEALRDVDKKGWMKIGNSLGERVAVARSYPTENGRIVRVLIDRPITFFEVVRSLRTNDYPFGIIEVEVDEKGKGEGQLIAAASITVTEEGLKVESFGIQPLRLLNVKIR